MSKKGTKALASATLMSLVLTTALSAGPVQAAQGQVTRVGEADRYATAASVATKNWKTSDNVILVSGEGYADAVSASALAKKLDAPILLTSAGTLSTDTQKALETLKAKNVYVVGGNASVSQSVRDGLKAKYALVELGGANRYETNAAVAQKLVDLGVKADNVIMVGGEGFSDALSVAPVAAAKGQILLLGMNDANYMKPVLDFVAKNKSKVTVVGTKNVISDSILSTVSGTRVDGGSDRWDTNLKVLAAFKADLKMDKLYIASASYNAKDDGYADALVASALAGKTASPLVLVDKDGATGTTNAVTYIEKNATKTTDLNVVGGTGVVGDSVVTKINDAVNGTHTGGGASTVGSVEATNLNQVKIVFDSKVDEDSAETVSNYKIDGSALTDAQAHAELQDDGQTVVLTLLDKKEQYKDYTISVKKGILTEDKTGAVAAFDKVVNFVDTTVPTLKSVEVKGNNKLVIKFSEAVNMKDVNSIADKVKINGQSIKSFGLDSTLSEVKECITNGTVTAGSSTNSWVDQISGASKTWSSQLELYFNSALPTGSNTLKVNDGVADGILSDAAGFSFKESTLDFSVDTQTTKPVVKTVEGKADGKIWIKFDQPMDKDTALDPDNYEFKDHKLSWYIANGYPNLKLEFKDNDYSVRLKGLSKEIAFGDNVIYITDNVKDAYGYKVEKDTRVKFTQEKDETKPTVVNTTIVDSETIRVKFSKDMDYSYAIKIANYKLKDSNGVDITNHIKEIKAASGVSGDTDAYDIKLYKTAGDDGVKNTDGTLSTEDWRLTNAKTTLTIKNLIDTTIKQNAMDDKTITLDGNDDVSPKATEAVRKAPENNASVSHKVVIYFSEEMSNSTIENADNYRYTNKSGDTKTLPSGSKLSAGGDNKSVTIEFPSSFVINPDVSGDTDNIVTRMTVANVKDEAGNVIDGVAKDITITDSVSTENRAKIKDNSFKLSYDGDDIIAEFQYDRIIDNLHQADFTVAGVTPDSASINSSAVKLRFKDGVKADSTYKKVDIIKAAGINALLNSVANKDMQTKDTSDTIVNGVSNVRVYDYQLAPKTSSDHWIAKDGKVTVTFDSLLDKNSGVKVDDFIFSSVTGDLKASNVEIINNTIVFSGFSNTDAFKSANGVNLDQPIKVRVKDSVNIYTSKDLDDGYATYKASDDDLKNRDIKYVVNHDDTTSTGTFDTGLIDATGKLGDYSGQVTPDTLPKGTVEKVTAAPAPGQTIVIVSLPATADATKYTVTVAGKALDYDATTKKFAGVVAKSYADAATAQKDVVVAKVAVVVLPTATVEKVTAAPAPGQTIVIATLPAGTDGTKYTVKVGTATLDYDAATKKFAGVVAKSYATPADAQKDITVEAVK